MRRERNAENLSRTHKASPQNTHMHTRTPQSFMVLKNNHVSVVQYRVSSEQLYCAVYRLSPTCHFSIFAPSPPLMVGPLGPCSAAVLQPSGFWSGNGWLLDSWTWPTGYGQKDLRFEEPNVAGLWRGPLMPARRSDCIKKKRVYVFFCSSVAGPAALWSVQLRFNVLE